MEFIKRAHLLHPTLPTHIYGLCIYSALSKDQAIELLNCFPYHKYYIANNRNNTASDNSDSSSNNNNNNDTKEIDEWKALIRLDLSDAKGINNDVIEHIPHTVEDLDLSLAVISNEVFLFIYCYYLIISTRVLINY